MTGTYTIIVYQTLYIVNNNKTKEQKRVNKKKSRRTVCQHCYEALSPE